MSNSGRTTDEYTLTDADVARFRAEQQRGMIPIDSAILAKKAQLAPLGLLSSPQVQNVVNELYAVALDQRDQDNQDVKRRTLVGLAAPQIGNPYRIIIVDTTVDEGRKRYGDLVCFINPTIVWQSKETEEGREGCFSAGPVWGLVRRPVAIKVHAYSPEGKEFTMILEGMGARIACHEIDHLDGIRFPDRIRSERKRHWVHTEELPIYVKEITHWKRICTNARWNTLKKYGLEY